MDKSVEKRIQSWLEGPFDAETKAEIRRLLEVDPKSLSDAFFKDLSFGTGGMRALVGIGTNRLNIYTIQMATQGLANYIKKQPADALLVFIGYDVRNNSSKFAENTAKVLEGNGIRALLSKEVCPTPLVSFACRHFGCKASVMITASHNPKEYNGYKVYWEGGAQVVAPHDIGIIEEVKKIKSPDQVLLKDAFTEVGKELDEAYLKELKKLQMLPAPKEKAVQIIYTNLHGTGLRLIPDALRSWGYKEISLVEKQKSFDGNFPNAASPNPEEEKALELGMKQLKEEKKDLLIATDPDADRIGVAIPDYRFSGNEIACILLEHICKTLSNRGELPENGAFVKTIVTTELFKKIALSYGGKCIDVLTGFKYIGELIGIWEKSFDAYQYIFGAEESYGYLFGSFVRDKDAISTSCLIAETAQAAKEQSLILKDILYEIYRKYGIYRTALKNITFEDSKAGMDEMRALMNRLRKNPPKKIAGKSVVLFEDYLHGIGHLPPSDVLRFWLDDQSKLVIRPSGTEPKVKIYTEVMQEFEKDLPSEITSCDQRNQHLINTLIPELK